MTTPLQRAAVEYIRAGQHVLALTGKKPNGRVHGESWSFEDSFHGDPDENEVRQIERAFGSEVGTTGIAICIPPDYLVADVDTERAAKLLIDLGYQEDRNSVIARTKNGLHVWFWWPGADKNRWLGDGEQPDPGRTLLFKGLGGYVVAPPSIHLDEHGVVDGEYRWWGQALVDDGLLYMPEPLPQGVIERFARTDLWDADRADGKAQLATYTLVPAEGVPWYKWEKVWTYATDGLEKAIENAADGNQNNIIHWAACVARDEGVPLKVSMKRLLDAAIRGGHPRNRARDTIAGAYKRTPRA